MKMSKMLAEQFELKEKISLLKQIQEEFNYQAKGLSADQLSEEAIKKMSRYARYMKDTSRAANAITLVGESVDEFHDTAQNEEIAHGFHFASLGVSMYNFFRIPFMYLSAVLLNQPVPFTLSNNSRWLYSALLLALTITAIAAPATAPIIAFVSAGIGFAASSFFLGKLLYERYKLAREANTLEREIHIAKKAMEAIQEEAKQLEQQSQEATEEPAIIDICLKIAILKERHGPQKKLLEELYEQKLQNEQLKEQFDFKKVVFKSISLILATATIIGLVVSLFFPPVGLGILAGVAVTGAAYLLGRVLTPVFSSFGQWLKNKWRPTPAYEPLVSEDKELLQPEEALQNEKQEKENAKLLEEHDLAFSESPSLSSAEVLRELTETEHLTPKVHPKDAQLLEEHDLDISEPPHESTSEVLRELTDTEHLTSKVYHEDAPPVITPPLFSPKPAPSTKKQKKKESEDEEGESDSEHEQLIKH